MRTLPMLIRLAEDLRRVSMVSSPFTSVFEDPWRLYRLASMNEMARFPREKSLPQLAKDGYKVSIDVGQFQPQEISVKVVDNDVIVEGKYEDNSNEENFASGHFIRRYSLPKGYEAEKATPTISAEGILTITVPSSQSDKAKEKILEIQREEPKASEKLEAAGKEEK